MPTLFITYIILANVELFFKEYFLKHSGLENQKEKSIISSSCVNHQNTLKVTGERMSDGLETRGRMFQAQRSFLCLEYALYLLDGRILKSSKNIITLKMKCAPSS